MTRFFSLLSSNFRCFSMERTVNHSTSIWTQPIYQQIMAVICHWLTMAAKIGIQPSSITLISSPSGIHTALLIRIKYFLWIWILHSWESTQNNTNQEEFAIFWSTRRDRFDDKLTIYFHSKASKCTKKSEPKNENKIMEMC